MDTVIVANSRITDVLPSGELEVFDIDGEKISLGLFNVLDIEYNNNFGPHSVLARVNAFSCNFRDRALLHAFSDLCKKPNKENKLVFSPIGSEFSGVVEKVGSEVADFKIGDRVMANNSYPYKASGKFGGVITNFASQRLQIFNEDELIKVPDNMSDEEAAAFSLSAQTAYSMVRKATIHKGDTVLVTSLSSNTSLAIIEALKKYDVKIYATSTQEYVYEALKEKMGIKNVFNLHKIHKGSENIPRIDVVLDPFIDINLKRISPFLNYGARYVFCGLFMQSNKYDCTSSLSMNILSLYHLCITKNLSIIGNCIGFPDDLNSAINDYKMGKYHVYVDSVFSGKNVISFFTRTFKEKHIGKVIYKYQ